MTDAIEKPLQSLEITKAELQLSLSKEGLAYQQLLQECENVVFNRDNLNEERTALVNLRKVKSKLEGFDNPFTERWKNWNSAKKSLVEPVSELLARKEGEYRKIAAELAEEARKAEAEKQRKAAILSEIDNFFIAQSQAIANATDPQELVRIEKLIGSHKSAARYGEFLPLMAQKAQILAELIRTAKDAIKKIAELRAKESLAEASGDDQAILDSREAQEQLLAKISEIGEVVQTEAINMAVNSGVVEPEILTPAAPKPRRTSFRYEILDEKLAAKAGLMKLVPDEEKIDVILAGKRKDGIECTENGIRYYKHFDY